MNKKVFTVDGVELAMLKPTAKIRINAQLVYNKAWAEAEKSGSPLSRNLDDLAEKHGVWNKDKLEKVNSLDTEIISLERDLRSGSSAFSSIEDAKVAALKIRTLRMERLQLLRSRDDLYIYTAENYADNARIHYFVSQGCVYNDTGKLYFKSYEDFVENSEGEVAREAITTYFTMLAEDLSDETSNFYENQWLKRYNFVDEKYRLVNKQGHLVDNDGKLIDENYNYVDLEGNRVDRDGFPLTKEGTYNIEYVDF